MPVLKPTYADRLRPLVHYLAQQTREEHASSQVGIHIPVINWLSLAFDTAGEVRTGHAAINVANGERRVLARRMLVNHSPSRKKLSAAAVSTCPKRAFAKPM